MKNFFRQYRLPALVTIMIHITVLLVANWPKKSNPVPTVITTDCGGCFSDPVVELAKLVETWKIDENYRDEPSFALGEHRVATCPPIFPWIYCGLMDPIVEVRPDASIQRITRIDGVDLPAQRMLVGFPNIDLSGNSCTLIDHSKKHTARKEIAHRLVLLTTRMAMLGPRR